MATSSLNAGMDRRSAVSDVLGICALGELRRAKEGGGEAKGTAAVERMADKKVATRRCCKNDGDCSMGSE